MRQAACDVHGICSRDFQSTPPGGAAMHMGALTRDSSEAPRASSTCGGMAMRARGCVSAQGTRAILGSACGAVGQALLSRGEVQQR
jgi:hypothetical protein